MRIALIVGTAVSTMKDEKLKGRKLLIARETDLEGKPKGEPFVAVDTVDAGPGDLVIVAEGSAARQAELARDMPVDATIVGVLDSLEAGGKATYRKS